MFVGGAARREDPEIRKKTNNIKSNEKYYQIRIELKIVRITQKSIHSMFDFGIYS